MVSSFQQRVYDVCAKVPKGKVITYKQIASALGHKGYRAVGNALNKNPFSPQVPCHRVVASDGSLQGFALGIDKKKEMLESEGIRVENNKVKDLKKILFVFKDESV